MRNLYDLIPPNQIGDWEVRKIGSHIYLMEHASDGLEKVWMDDSNWEKSTHQLFVERARGDVFVGGLGLGYDCVGIEEKESVTSITCVEKEQAVYDLVAPFVTHPKTAIHRTNVLSYLEAAPAQSFDIIWFDIFPNDPVWFPNEVDILTAASAPKLKDGGEILFWKTYKPLQL